MKYLLSLLSLMILCSPQASAHGGHTATFGYHLGKQKIVLEFRMEQSVLHHFDFASQCENYQSATALCLANYIQAHSQVAFGEETLTFELSDAKKDGHHFVIRMVATGDFSSSDQLRIQNDCFFEFDPSFENRVVLMSTYGRDSYLLTHKKRKLSIRI
ncbi:MAG: hypothetical protein AAFV95_10285 [Bacteroidota bacterium]